MSGKVFPMKSSFLLTLQLIVCHENELLHDWLSEECFIRNFTRDGSRPTALGVQALIANRFMLL